MFGCVVFAWKAVRTTCLATDLIWKGSEIEKGKRNVALLLLLCRLEHRCAKHDLFTLPSTFGKRILRYIKKYSPALPIAEA